MRLLGAVAGDIKFQRKQGFYAVYIFLTIMYLIIIQKIPQGVIREYAVPLVVFSDPSLVGFFFIGGIVMLEKQQGIIEYLAVTPLSPREYLISKSASLGAVAVLASSMIAVVTFRGSLNWGLLIISVFLTSMFFTLYGFIAAAGCNTINQYFIRMVPYMLLIILPCFSIIDSSLGFLKLLPNVSGLLLIMGAFRGISAYQGALYITTLLIGDILIFKLALLVYDKDILPGGGSK